MTVELPDWSVSEATGEGRQVAEVDAEAEVGSPAVDGATPLVERTAAAEGPDGPPSWRDEPLTRRAAQLAAAIVVAQIVAVVVFGAITAVRAPLWSPVDEGAHFSNVAYIADHGSYPVLGKTLANEEAVAIGQGVYPRHTTIDRRTDGLAGLSYEAFQPPLYYYAAVPVFDLSGNYHTKAIALRFFGLLLLLAAIGLFARLSRRVLRARWLCGLAAGMLVFFMPGFVARMVIISNLALAVPLGILAVTELWIAWEERSVRRLPVCGLLVGCCLLTDLYLAVLVPLFGAVLVYAVWVHRDRAGALWAAAGAGLAVVVLVPWLAFDEAKYHALTAASLAKVEQQPTVNPHHLHYALGTLPGLTAENLFQPLLPQEWGGALIGHSLLNYLATVFQVLVIPVVAVLALALGRRLLTGGYWLLVAPWFLNIALIWYVQVGEQWEDMLPRYTLCTLPLLALAAAAFVVTRFRTVRPLLWTVAASAAFLLVLWIRLVPSIHTA